MYLLQEMNQIEGYTVTKRDPKEHLENYKRRFLVYCLSTVFIFVISKTVTQLIMYYLKRSLPLLKKK